MKCYPEHAENPVSIEVREGLITHYYGPSGIVPFEIKRNTLYINRRGDIGCELPGHAVGLGSDPEDRCGWRKLTLKISQVYATETGTAPKCWLCDYSPGKPEGVEKTLSVAVRRLFGARLLHQEGIMIRVGMNQFVRRQTKGSRFSYYSGSEDALLKLVEQHFPENKPGYKDGVVLVPVPPEGFFSGVVALDEATPLKATFQVRRKGEEPYVDVDAVSGKRLPAKVVDIVLYRHDVLEGDASTDCEWEIVSINARSTEEPEPMTPMAMARNFLELPGGTKANYTAEEFARSIAYWSKHAMVLGS